MVYNKSISKHFGERETDLPKKEQKTCLDAALGYLAPRMRSAYEMQNYLNRRGYTQDDIHTAMHRLCELGFIDDVQFADELVRCKTAMRPVGRRWLRRTLKQKGIEEENIENGLSRYTQQDEQQACDEMFRKLAQKHGTDRAGLVKIQRALLYRGFEYDMIKQAAKYAEGKDEWE